MAARLRVAFVSTHPIQYQASWFKAVAADPSLDLQVLYCHSPTADEQGLAGFGVPFTWDIPLFDGYSYRFLRNVSSTPSTRSFFGLDTPEVDTLIRNKTFDIVVTNGWHYKSAWQAITACRGAGVPVFVRSDSHLHTARHPLKRLAKALPYRWFISRLDGCLAVGQWSAEYFHHYGAAPDRVHIVRHAVAETFESEARSLAMRRNGLRRQWAISPDQVVFLFAGKFIPEKKPADFIRAIAQAGVRFTNIVGLMVGDGPLRAECEELARQLDARVRFAGFLNQSTMVQSYVAADALVLPSSTETWGLVVNEAMACGRPAIVSDRVGCGPDLVQSGVTGFTFPSGNVSQLNELLVACAAQPGRLAVMGDHARRLVDGHSVTASADAMVNALRSSRSAS